MVIETKLIFETEISLVVYRSVSQCPSKRWIQLCLKLVFVMSLTLLHQGITSSTTVFTVHYELKYDIIKQNKKCKLFS